MTPAEKVQQWIDNGGDFNAGLLLLSEIGKNKSIIRIMSGRPKRYAGKLKYELLKAVRTSKMEIVAPDPENEDTGTDTGTGEDTGTDAGTGEDTGTDAGTGEDTGTDTGTGEEPAETPNLLAGKKQAETKAIVPGNEKREDWRDKTGSKQDQETYPPDIEKIKSEYSRLYNLRAQQHSLMTDVPPDNTAENVKKRKVLSDSISEISQRLELLYAAKEAYFENGTMPDMQTLFAPPAEEKEAELPNDIAELKKMKKTLQISIHKAKNKLEYQEETKQRRANPMPPGPKRLDLEKTIEEKQGEVEKIEFKIVELAHTR